MIVILNYKNSFFPALVALPSVKGPAASNLLNKFWTVYFGIDM